MAYRSLQNRIIDAFCKVKDGLNFDGDSYYIGDSATYTEDNVQRLGKDILWITRVPATINEVKVLLDGDFDMIPTEDSVTASTLKDQTMEALSSGGSCFSLSRCMNGW